MFTAAAALMDVPPERLAIPFEGTTLPGWFFRPRADGRPRPTLILTGGYDGNAEELYLLTGAAALARGYNVLAFDGPGQGAALLQQGLIMRPDWETVVSAVVDAAIGRSDVDADRIALVGLSLGAHLAPRAATAEHRLAAVVADCGSRTCTRPSWPGCPAGSPAGWPPAGPGPGSSPAPSLSRLVRKPTAGWALRRGMAVHGVRSPLAYLDELRAYRLTGRAGRISCPTWICYAEGDDVSAAAPELAGS